ncbi:MAG: chemotaxis protein CheW [Gammaproteobacteria bacterium]|nr:chemotaxis protein CheW [Gammaproteobacteria bacterium]MDH5593690.1 chemotaxis protein CheW [Gammaproteobacteria bacterium]
MTAQTGNPLTILKDIEKRCLASAIGLPLQAEIKRPLLALAFRIGETSLAAPLGEVKEILTYPEISRVPKAKEWVKGIANIRGNLLPIMDLQGCLGRGKVAINKHCRVLVINNEIVSAGLVVDEVFGLRYFMEEQETKELPDIDESIKQYLSGSFRDENGLLGIFSVSHLTESPDFMQVAV